MWTLVHAPGKDPLDPEDIFISHSKHEFHDDFYAFHEFLHDTDVPAFGAYSSRDAITGSSQADPVKKNNAGGSAGARRVFAWADPDAVTNGYSGPSNSTGSKLARINQNASPVGGPAECPWSTNNCGPNDEPFAFHPGGCNVVMADGSIRFTVDSIDGVAVKWLVGAKDGQPTPDF